MATATLARQIGRAITKATNSTGSGNGWFSPHMAAASRAIAERIPLVDLVLEVRDARIPLSSAYDQLRNYTSSSKRIIVMNKMDLANHSQLKDWMKYFEQKNYISYGVNAHNKESIQQLLNFLQARVRELKKVDHSSYTTTILLVGIPNVGKSALANSLHRIGRISAAEKGKLKHATVSPQPGETKNITGLKPEEAELFHPHLYLISACGPTDFGSMLGSLLLQSRELGIGTLSKCENEQHELLKLAETMFDTKLPHGVTMMQPFYEESSNWSLWLCC